MVSVKCIGYVSSCNFVLNACNVIFRSVLLAYGVMGSIEVVLNVFVGVPSVIEMILGVVFVTVNGSSHLRQYSQRTRTPSPGDIR